MKTDPTVLFFVNNLHLEYAEWVRTAGIDDNGDIWVHAGACGNEAEDILSAVFDGEPVSMCDGHCYLRIKWFRASFPKQAEELDVLERNIRKVATAAIEMENKT